MSGQAGKESREIPPRDADNDPVVLSHARALLTSTREDAGLTCSSRAWSSPSSGDPSRAFSARPR